MNTKTVLFSLVYIIISISCSKNMQYTPEYMESTSGRYLLNQDEVIEVFYDNEKLFLKWKGAEKIKPVII
ncbi:tetratricopeptide repeat protein, partial [Algibacter sp.]|nr:tetratricopeptide repeat protein [Algibacter sp.]